MKKWDLWENHTFQIVLPFCAYLALVMPFHYFFSIAGNATDVRPAVSLQVFFGMVFGFRGALGCALANFTADMIYGIDVFLALGSFPIQILMGYIPYRCWYALPLRGEEYASTPRMLTVRHLVKFVVVVLSSAFVTTVMLGILMFLFDTPELLHVLYVMFFNNVDFSILIGLSLFTLLAWTQHQYFSLTEYLILSFLGIAVLSSFLTGFFTWWISSHFSDEIYQIWAYIQGSVGVTLNIFMVLGVIAIAYIERNFTLPIQNLAKAAETYAEGGGDPSCQAEFIAVCDVYRNSRIEVGNLARAYSNMMESMVEYMKNLARATEKNQRIEADLDVARDIQNGTLPHDFNFHRTDFEVYAYMQAAREVGGDFYDFYMIDDYHLVVTIADVSGKGVPAALFMMRSKTILKNITMMSIHPDDLGAALAIANQQLFENNPEMMFVTVFLGILDVKTGEFRYANAGHNPPLVVQSASGERRWKYLRSKQRDHMLGVVEEAEYEMHKILLAPGDMIFLYTDGVTEAMDRNERFYSEERLRKTLARVDVPFASMKEVLAGVRADIEGYTDGAEQSDDITMLGLRYRGLQL